MSRSHRVEKLFAHDPAMGEIYMLQSSSDASSIAYLACHDPGGAYREPKIVWNGRIMAESDCLLGSGEISPDLSPDGRHLAIHRFDRQRGRWTIDLDGQPRWLTDLTTVHYTGWLDGERFAWEGWTDEGDRRAASGLRYFVNGDEVTGRLSLQGVSDTRRSGLCVTDMERGVRYTVWQDGSRTPESKIVRTGYGEWVREDDWKVTGMLPERDPRDRPSVTHGRAQRLCQVTYRGIASPTTFHGVENRSGLRTFAVSEDEGRIGYVGIRYRGWAMKLGEWVERRFEREDEREKKNGGEMTKRGWILAMLFNPYTGAGLAAMESSKRYYPVNTRYFREDGVWKLEERVWKKGYRFAAVDFLTPSGELVVTAHEGRSCRVVIDEAEGPVFDRVWGLRHSAAGDLVSYVGMKDGTLHRVLAEK